MKTLKFDIGELSLGEVSLIDCLLYTSDAADE